MFTAIKAHWFQSKVLADLRAQHHDPGFVSAMFRRAEVRRELERLRRDPLVTRAPMGPFLAACQVLTVYVAVTDGDTRVQRQCVSLLRERLRKARANRVVYEAHEAFFTELEARLQRVSEPQAWRGARPARPGG